MASRTIHEKWVNYACWLFLLLFFVLLALVPTWWAARPLAYMCSGATVGLALAQKLLIETHNVGQREMPPSRQARTHIRNNWVLRRDRTCCPDAISDTDPHGLVTAEIPASGSSSKRGRNHKKHKRLKKAAAFLEPLVHLVAPAPFSLPRHRGSGLRGEVLSGKSSGGTSLKSYKALKSPSYTFAVT
jgi:hypothetical protein